MKLPHCTQSGQHGRSSVEELVGNAESTELPAEFSASCSRISPCGSLQHPRSAGSQCFLLSRAVPGEAAPGLRETGVFPVLSAITREESVVIRAKRSLAVTY